MADANPFAVCVPSHQEELSPLSVYPVDDLIDNLSLISVPPMKDPFVGSDLTDFSLSAVSAAVGSRRSGDSLESEEEALWSMVQAGENGRPEKVPKDRVKRLYRQERGIFAPPTWPAALPIPPRITEEGKSWTDLQSQWGMNALADTASEGWGVSLDRAAGRGRLGDSGLVAAAERFSI